MQASNQAVNWLKKGLDWHKQTIKQQQKLAHVSEQPSNQEVQESAWLAWAIYLAAPETGMCKQTNISNIQRNKMLYW